MAALVAEKAAEVSLGFALVLEPGDECVSEVAPGSSDEVLEALSSGGPLACVVRGSQAGSLCFVSSVSRSSSQAWVSLRVLGDDSAAPNGSPQLLSALCQVVRLVAPETLLHAPPPIGAVPPRLLFHKSSLLAVATRLVRVGCLVGPARALCQLPPGVSELMPVPEDHVGIWKLRRSAEDVIRIQAGCGLWVETCLPADSSNGEGQVEASCGVLAPGAAGNDVRHRTVSFAPPLGMLHPRSSALSPQGNVLRVSAASGPAGREEAEEEWHRMEGESGGSSSSSKEVVALELVSEEPPWPLPRAGVWLFCGGHFVRCVGPRQGEGTVAGACCRDLEQLRRICGKSAVNRELQGSYEAVLGTVERPGRLLLSRRAWAPACKGEVYYDAQAGGTRSLVVTQ
ncbi:unnamed protein product, partial [Polarella glacialis]